MKSRLFFESTITPRIIAFNGWRPVLIAALALAACDSGPSESDFVAACMKQGQSGANKMLSREMGVDRQSFCKCAAQQSRSTASADSYRWMILDMDGKRQEARAIEAKMSESDRMALMQAGIEVFGKCAGTR